MKKNLFKNISNKAYFTILTIIVLAAVVLLNIIFSFFTLRYDLTKDKRYSLTPSTISFLSEDNLSNRILFKIYLEGEMPAEIQRLRTSIQNKLDEFKYYAGSNIEYEFINPNEGSKEDQEALKEQLYDKGRGIRPVNITYRKKGSSNILELFPGATVEYAGSTVGSIRFLEGGTYNLDERLENLVQRSINNIEYKLMQSISKATRRTKKTVAFIHGHGELRIPYTQGARRRIEDAYVIEDVKLNESLEALNDVDGIIIAEPTEKYSDKDRFIIDQFLMQGGNVMLFYNPLSINNDTIRRTGMVHSTRKRIGLEKMIFDYGIKINEDLVVDANYDRFIMPGLPRGFVNWYFYVRALGTAHPISAMVDPVKLPYVASLQFVENENNVKPSVILTSSSNAKSYGNAPLLSISIEQNFGENPQFQEDPDDPANRLMLGAIVEGKFESAFKNRIAPTYAEDPNAFFEEKSAQPGKLMVVGNGTFFKNAFYDSIFVREEGKYKYIPRLPRKGEIDELLATNQKLGNFDFFENCVDYMLEESTLLSIRSRTIDLHPTDKLKVEKYSNFYKFINLFIPVLIILIIALTSYMIRYYKYIKKN